MLKGKYKYVLLVICLLVIGFGVSYAFFDYYRLGNSHQVIAGEVSMKFNEGTDTISLSNVFPETKEEARSRDDNFITFTISGINTTTNKDVYYEIMLNEGEEESGKTRFESKDLVFDLVEVNSDGTETYLVDAMNYNDFNERRIWVETVDHNTTNQLNKTYKLRMWLSGDVIISDTESYADYTTSVFKNSYASVKVSVYGDFLEKNIPYNYMDKSRYEPGNFWPQEIEDVKANIESVEFLSMKKSDIALTTQNLTQVYDVTDTTKSGTGSVIAWLEEGTLVTNDDSTQTQYYKMYVVSEGTTFFPSDSSNMFYNFNNLTSIIFENINTVNVTNMQNMFESCTSLIELDLSNFDTSSVVNMICTFARCGSLSELNLEGWDTSNVVDMYGMFYNCSGFIDTIDVNHFDVSKVQRMEVMFAGCSQMTNLNLSNWNISSLVNTLDMFNTCSNLVTIYSNSDWNIGLISSSDNMFAGCEKLVGAVSYDYNKVDINMANPTTGYFTKKSA